MPSIDLTALKAAVAKLSTDVDAHFVYDAGLQSDIDVLTNTITAMDQKVVSGTPTTIPATS